MVPIAKDEPPPKSPWVVPAIVSAVVGALVLYRVCVGGDTKPPTSVSPVPSASADASAPPTSALPRCAEVAPDPFVIGDAPQAPKPAPEADADTDPNVDFQDPIAPFAVEVGRGAVFEGGFAAGITREAEGGAVAMVATVGIDGRGGKLVRLGRSRGDLDPPVVTGAGGSVLAAMLEPNASGRAVKIAKVTGTEVAWGPEFSEGHDDSLSVDLAVSGSRAVVVWDDVLRTPEHGERSSVMLATLDTTTMRSVTVARPVSAPKIDAGSPRVISRPGGYWLAYVVLGEADAKKPAKKGEDEEDDTAEGEAIAKGWIEVAPLDEAGAVVSTPTAVTPKKGYAHSFDLELAEDGGALVGWRDDDTPTGAGGGKLSTVLVQRGGPGPVHVIAEDIAGTGIPDLIPGFIAVASGTGPTRLAALGPSGSALEELATEPSLGAGHPLAATKGSILWARPLGKAMRLSVVRCSGPATDAGVPSQDGG